MKGGEAARFDRLGLRTLVRTHRVKDISSILLLRVSWTIMFPNYLLCNDAISVCASLEPLQLLLGLYTCCSVIVA